MNDVVLTSSAWMRWFWCLSATMLAAIGIGTAAVGIVALAGGTLVALVDVLPMASLGWFAGKAAMRIPRTGVTITSTEVVIVGPFRTWQVPLSDADHFVAGTGASGNQPTVSLSRKTGRSIGIWALNRNGFIWNFKRIVASLQPTVETLNSSLVRANSRS
jgi:hypothetical protein